MKQLFAKRNFTQFMLARVLIIVLLSMAATRAVQAASSFAPAAPAGASTLGDFVWHDLNADGAIDANEPGINGVVIQLYLDDGDGVFEPNIDDVLLAGQTTGDDPSTPNVVEQGWYDFDLDFGPTVFHWVYIPPLNFAPGGALEGYVLTSGATNYPNPGFVIEPQPTNDRNDLDFGFAKISLDLQKSVYLGHNNGASCAAGAESVAGVNGAAVTFCFAVTNTGTDSSFNPIVINDATLGITTANLTLVSGALPLAPGQTVIYYYQTTITADLTNTATVTGNPTDSNGTDLPAVDDISDTDTAAVDKVAPQIEVQKTVYLGYNSGNGCATAGETVIGVNATQVTYCFTVTNTGDTYFTPLTVNDPALNITVSNLTIKSGSLPLAPGQSIVYYYQSTITNDLLNTVTVAGNPTTSTGADLPGVPDASDTDTAAVDRINPQVDLQKTVYLNHNNGASCASGVESVTGINGAAITFCFTVRNLGDTYLKAVTISDPTLSINTNNLTLVSGALPLAPGQSVVYYYQTTITADFTNTATVTATPTDVNNATLPGVNNVTDTDTAAVDKVAPQIDVQKSVYLGYNSGNGCATAGEMVVGVNATQVTYCFTVTNTGDTYFTPLTVNDPALNITVSNLTIKSGSLPLAPGQSIVYYYQGAITNDLVNTVTVAGNPTTNAGADLPGVPDVSDTDTAAVDRINPQVDLQKTVYLNHNNGASCSLGAESVAGVNGAAITFCFAVRNLGDTYLKAVTISDPTLSINTNNLTLVSGALPLAPGQTAIYYYQTTITSDFTNTATVTATPTDVNNATLPGVNNVTDTDTAAVDKVAPQISVQKTVYLGHDNGGSCPGIETVISANNSPVTFCFAVTNTGDTYLNAITLDDPLLGANELSMTLVSGVLPLAPGASLRYYFEALMDADITNTVTASGNPVTAGGVDLPGLNNPTASDTAQVDVQGPGLRLDKTIYLSHDNGASCPGVASLIASVGDNATYCFEVTNTGDAYLSDITLVDPALNTTINDLQLISGSIPLAPGGKLRYYYEVVVSGPLQNTATASGNPTDAQGNDLPGFGRPASTDTANLSTREGSISGVVWLDKNSNGVADPNEPGISGVLVTLSNGQTAVTDPNGAYQFNGLVDGVYAVTEIDLPGYISTGDVDGGNPNLISNLVISDGNDITGRDFFDAPTVGEIIGTVFNDANGNLLQDGGEPGLANVTITLSNGQTTTTDATGHYTFTNVVPGVYLVSETDPAGFASTTNNFVPVFVPAGGVAVANFGDKQVGLISGVVFNDVNGDGLKSNAEVGLGGVVVTLLDANGNIIRTTVTASDGTYSFPDMPPGVYTVRETDPNGFVSTTNNTVAVSVPPGGSATANFGDQQVGQVSGVVFNDANGDGVQGVGENGLLNVVVQLLDTTGKVIGTTVTNGDGAYLFTDVPGGAYTVRETDPDGFTSTTNNTVPVSVPNGGSATANFGDQESGQISGIVFNDINGDGVKNSGENGLSGVVVTLLDEDGNVLNTTVTGPDGNYVFNDVPPGAYTVRESDPNGFTSTTNNTVPVSVPAGGSATANFGDQQVGQVSGVVFDDVNGDGVQGPGENGLNGVVIELIDADGNVVATTTTTNNGSYSFPDVTPGVYVVREQADPVGYTSTTNNQVPVVVPPDGQAIANFGDRQVGQISGVVFNDTDGDGRQDANENGLGSVLVELVDSQGNVIATTLTTGNGSYMFDDVPPGAYTVRESDPAGFASTTPNTVAVTVPPNGSATANFGDRQAGTISGVVFNDTNGDGAQGAGENGLGGVVVELLDANGNVVATTTTAGNGSYVFTTVLPGEYIVRESDPDGYASTTPNDVIVSVPPGGAGNANFGDQQAGTISGVVFDDVNGNGVQDPGEKGIGGVAVDLIDSDGNIIETTVTSGDGTYVFIDVLPGEYTIRENNLKGTVSTTLDLVTVVVVEDTPTTVNFGDQISPTALDDDEEPAVTHSLYLPLVTN